MANRYEKSFLDYLEGRMSPEQEKEIAAALEADPQLKASFEAYKQVIESEKMLASSEQPSLGPNFDVKVMNAVEAADRGFLERLSRLFAMPPRRLVASLATVAMVVIIIKIGIDTPHSSLEMPKVGMEFESTASQAASAPSQELLLDQDTAAEGLGKALAGSGPVPAPVSKSKTVHTAEPEEQAKSFAGRKDIAGALKPREQQAPAALQPEPALEQLSRKARGAAIESNDRRNRSLRVYDKKALTSLEGSRGSPDGSPDGSPEGSPEGLPDDELTGVGAVSGAYKSKAKRAEFDAEENFSDSFMALEEEKEQSRAFEKKHERLAGISAGRAVRAKSKAAKLPPKPGFVVVYRARVFIRAGAPLKLADLTPVYRRRGSVPDDVLLQGAQLSKLYARQDIKPGVLLQQRQLFKTQK